MTETKAASAPAITTLGDSRVIVQMFVPEGWEYPGLFEAAFQTMVNRLAKHDHRFAPRLRVEPIISVKQGDLVFVSSIFPGEHRRPVAQTVNTMFRTHWKREGRDLGSAPRIVWHKKVPA
jgi:hypothetical protein